jgi:hypothetical protein
MDGNGNGNGGNGRDTRSGKFLPGNTAAVGHRGIVSKQAQARVTSALVERLNKVNPDTGRKELADVVDKVVKMARGYVERYRRGDREVEVYFPPNERMIELIFDRLDGKAVQPVAMGGLNGGPVEIEIVRKVVEPAKVIEHEPGER